MNNTRLTAKALADDLRALGVTLTEMVEAWAAGIDPATYIDLIFAGDDHNQIVCQARNSNQKETHQQ